MAECIELTVEPESASTRETGALCSSVTNTNGHLAAQQSNLKLHFRNVSYTVKQNKSKTKKILNDTCGEFHSGRLTAILGPSGAGKSSMLNVLSGFKANGVSGLFEINDSERNLMDFRKISSYIPQDFAMLNLLTVHETLQVSADLKLSSERSPKEKQKIIDDILQLLNMNKCRCTLVRNLSGGERKRLSIGVELVTNPPVMFFDEPTSGLDSVASLQVINYLQRLARDGRIIICVIHQPSSRLMKLFDDVLVMSRGEVLYAGPRADMLPYFEEAGFTCPNYYNPADFVLEVSSELHSKKILALIQRNKEINGSRRCSVSDEKTEMLPKSAALHTSNEPNHIGDVQQFKPTNQSQAMLRPKTQVSVWRQFSVLVRRSLLTMCRNLLAVQLRVIMHIVVAVLLGIVFWNIGNDASKVLTNSSCIFFVVLFIFFGNAMPSILLCPQETDVFLREYFNGWYSIWSYFLAKIIADIPMQLACPTFFISIVYVMTGQPEEFDRFVMCWGICLLTAIIGHFFGLVFGSTFDMPFAIFLVPSSTIPIMIFSGFFIRIHELADYLQPLCDFSFFRYTMEGFVQAIYGYERPDMICHVDFCYFKSPVKFLKELDMWGNLYGQDVIGLLIWIAALVVLFFLSLVLRIKRSQ